jgi:folylpolyglutamate synthase
VHLANAFLGGDAAALESKEEQAPAAFVSGLAAARWPGRCQTVVDPATPSTRWHLDGAHTRESLLCSAQWFFAPGVGLPSESDSPYVDVSSFHFFFY